LHKSYHKGASSDRASICDAQAVSEDQEKSSQRGGKDFARAIRAGVNIIILKKYVCIYVCVRVVLSGSNLYFFMGPEQETMHCVADMIQV
jgi:hypothetical protein